jgi:hypothetical protein
VWPHIGLALYRNFFFDEKRKDVLLDAADFSSEKNESRVEDEKLEVLFLPFICILLLCQLICLIINAAAACTAGRKIRE